VSEGGREAGRPGKKNAGGGRRAGGREGGNEGGGRLGAWEGGSGRHPQRVGSRHSPAWQLPGLDRVYALRAVRTRFRGSGLGEGGGGGGARVYRGITCENSGDRRGLGKYREICLGRV
jgi:hypothetical protein